MRSDIPLRGRFSLRGVRAARDLAAARTCYDHLVGTLVGTLGVSLYDGLVANDLIDASAGLALTPAGRNWFAELAGETALRPRGPGP